MPSPLPLLDTPCGRDVAVALSQADVDPRGLSAVVFDACGNVRGGTRHARERARAWESWRAEQRQAALVRVDELLRAAWPDGCTIETVLGTTHRHLGDLAGSISVDRCRRKEHDPAFTKPTLAFWTCPVVPGTGPVGFETLVRELNPRRSYASWDVHVEACRMALVDSPADWERLVHLTGADPTREAPSPRWDELPYDAVHVTNRAIIGSFAPGATCLWDWGLEQTAWFRPRATYERRSATETWEAAVARLTRAQA